MNGRALVTRRGLLIGGSAVIAGGAGGAIGWLTVRDRPRPAPRPVPRAPVLEAELAREQALLARFAATTAPPAGLATRLAWLQADHTAHAEALRALLSELGVPLSGSGSGSASASASASGSGSAGNGPVGVTPSPAGGPPGTPAPTPPAPFTSVAEVIAEETAAARSAAAASLQLAGSAAATLASVSACESAHVALLA